MKGKKRIWSVCIMLILVFIFAGVFYYYFQKNQPQKKSEGTLIMQTGMERLCQ